MNKTVPALFSMMLSCGCAVAAQDDLGIAQTNDSESIDSIVSAVSERFRISDEEYVAEAVKELNAAQTHDIGKGLSALTKALPILEFDRAYELFRLSLTTAEAKDGNAPFRYGSEHEIPAAVIKTYISQAGKNYAANLGKIMEAFFYTFYTNSLEMPVEPTVNMIQHAWWLIAHGTIKPDRDALQEYYNEMVGLEHLIKTDGTTTERNRQLLYYATGPKADRLATALSKLGQDDMLRHLPLGKATDYAVSIVTAAKVKDETPEFSEFRRKFTDARAVDLSGILHAFIHSYAAEPAADGDIPAAPEPDLGMVAELFEAIVKGQRADCYISGGCEDDA